MGVRSPLLSTAELCLWDATVDADADGGNKVWMRVTTIQLLVFAESLPTFTRPTITCNRTRRSVRP